MEVRGSDKTGSEKPVHLEATAMVWVLSPAGVSLETELGTRMWAGAVHLGSGPRKSAA